MLHYIFALFIVLLTQSITTEFTQPKISQSKSSQNCSAILDSISKESKDKKEKIKQDLDKITVFIPTKDFYKKKLLDPAQTNDQSISIPKTLKEDDDEDNDDEKEIDQIAKILQNVLPANNSHLEMNSNSVSVNPNYGIGIINEEKQQNKKKTQLDVDLNLALHLNFDKNLELIYSRHKDKSSTDNSSFLNAKTLLGICAGAGITYLIIKTAPVSVPIVVAVAAARKDSKHNYAFCAPCDDFTSNQDQNLPIIWILQEENHSNSTKENIIAGLTQEGSIKIPTGVTAIGVAGAAAGAAGLGLSIGLGSGAGTVVATAGGIVITGTVIPVIIGGAVVGYTVKLSIDAVRELIQHVKHKRAEKKAKKDLEKNNAGGGRNRNNNDKDPKDKNDLTPKHIPNKNTKEHPEGIYKENPKHNQNSRTGVGKPPPNGQKAYKESIKVPGKTRQRVAVQDGKIIALKEHTPGEWHAYIEENFYNLDPEAQQALVDAGWVRSIKSGKIIKK